MSHDSFPQCSPRPLIPPHTQQQQLPKDQTHADKPRAGEPTRSETQECSLYPETSVSQGAATRGRECGRGLGALPKAGRYAFITEGIESRPGSEVGLSSKEHSESFVASGASVGASGDNIGRRASEECKWGRGRAGARDRLSIRIPARQRPAGTARDRRAPQTHVVDTSFDTL
ncbi:hypothetical protein EYF80_010147 [Liparis tanakae]|uniref:Uncharacterized protein n=1 Tax=Liparis tanakae TaxID=230148 RepID=A0A4Z2INU3_9TELE|nr:hypothetical protein EYF80_010147 [Liparis tanakae]